MEYLLEHVTPMLSVDDCVVTRQGAIEAVTCVVDALSADVVPYIVLLVVPVLSRMSDQDESVRLMASQCFATLIKLLPLEVRYTHNSVSHVIIGYTYRSSTIPSPQTMYMFYMQHTSKCSTVVYCN